MKKSKERYSIEYRKLGIGKHSLQFELKKDFFELFDYSDYKNGNILVNIDLDIKNSNIICSLNFSGFIEVQCDICLEYFNHPVKSSREIVFKFVETIPEIDTNDDLIYISNKSVKIDLKKHLYDYIILSLPIKKVHPLDKQGNRTCNAEILKKLEDLKSSETTQDPRWDKLKKLFN